MNLSTARLTVRQFARNAQDSSLYTDSDIDRAIAFVGQQFCRNTRAIRSLGVSGLAASQSSFAILSSGVSLMPENLIDLYLGDGTQLRIIDIDEFLRKAVTTGNGKPLYACIEDSVDSVPAGSGFTVQLWPPSDGLLSPIRYRLWMPFTEWLPGSQGAYSSAVQYQKGDMVSDTGAIYIALQPSLGQSLLNAAYWKSLSAGTVSDPSAILLNLPDAWLMRILAAGPPARLQMHEPENAKIAAAKWADYQAMEKDYTGAGSLGVASSPRYMQC